MGTPQTEPDGIEVVATTAEAGQLESPPLLVIDAVEDWLDGAGIGEGPIAWERIGDGQSNVTYSIRRADHQLVLRRGPRPPLPKSTHDMVREARIQHALGEAGVPVPKILGICDDESVLGVPFYVMSFLDGEIITDTVPTALDSRDQREATSAAAVDALLSLHSVDLNTSGLSSFGRPEGYLRRQVGRFAGLWEQSTTRHLPEVAQLAEWLDATLPDSAAAAMVHGDYRLGNVMFARTAPARVVALLDWEMATLGDPLADLGYLTATYGETGFAVTPLELTPVTREEGYLRRDDLVERYAAAGADLPYENLPWYQALALWKAAVFCEAIYTRWLHGERPDDTEFGPSLERGVPVLLEAARSFAHLPSPR